MKEQSNALTRDVFLAGRIVSLIIQGDEDPTIVPKSAKTIYSHLGSEQKDLVLLKRKHHGIVRGEGQEEVFQLIRSFIAKNI